MTVLGIEDKQGIAREVKCSVRKIDDLMARRAIPFLKLPGRLVRFDVAKVKAALARFEVREVGDRKGGR
jgi:excisionase family DNA binding protein